MIAVSGSSQLRKAKRRRDGGGTRAPNRPHRQLETTGLIVIAILILAITVLRYWHNINWRAR
jgi:hypothetical protein